MSLMVTHRHVVSSLHGIHVYFMCLMEMVMSLMVTHRYIVSCFNTEDPINPSSINQRCALYRSGQNNV